MSLPTPPSTSHREEKENRVPSGSRVVWSPNDQFHFLTSPPRFSPSKAAATTPKSILKKSENTLAPVAADVRETTPEPSDPLVDLNYLQSSVSAIIALETPLRQLVEAYSILAARLRSCVGGVVDVDSTWPLFQPLRENREAITEAITRDLGKALEEPKLVGEEIDEPRCSLPSPVKTPRKKGGLSAEQVKYARDLCHTCHAVIRLLAFVFTTPALYNIFTDMQLDSMMTQLLAIPMAESLPTPNARKTCALAIWLISAQRLPSEVLRPARDRIAYAVRRGIDGELGKEGKKGAVSDGLKAVHDLSLHQPEIFVPAFTDLLPSVFACVIGSTLTLRVQACHALGGFAYAATTIPRDQIHTRISTAAADFFTDGLTSVPSASPEKKSPSKSASKDPLLIRALRTTLVATDPQHPAQGPVWALCVLANLIILIGPALYTSPRLERTIRAMLAVAMRTKRGSVRALLCLVSRCLTWVYFQPPLPPNPDSESEVEDSDVEGQSSNVRALFWELVTTPKDMGCGVNLVTALLADPDSRNDDRFEHAFEVLRGMLNRGGQTREDAVQVLRRLVALDLELDSEDAFEMHKLLPKPLFSTSPGLLTTDYHSLSSAVKPIFAFCPQIEAVTPLSRDEISREWILDELLDVWRQCFCCIEMPDEADPPEEIVAIWDSIIKANVSSLQDADGDDAISDFASHAVEVVIRLMREPTLDVRMKGEVLSPGPIASSPIKRSRKPAEMNHRSHASLLLTIVKSLWASLRTTVSRELLSDAGQRLLSVLWELEDTFSADAHLEWSQLCAEILVISEDDCIVDFWRNTSDWTAEARHVCWTTIAELWKQDAKASWDGAIRLLCLPFSSAKSWELDEGDIKIWESLTAFTISSALDFGHDTVDVLDRVAHSIAAAYDPSSTSIVRAVDVLLSQVPMAEIRELPSSLFQLVNEALLASYPPEPRGLIHVGWLLRTLTEAVERCQLDQLVDLLDTVSEGISTWVSDEHAAVPMDDYSYNVVGLYEMILVSLQSLKVTRDTAESLGPLLEASVNGRQDKPSSVSVSLNDLWTNSWSNSLPSDALPNAVQLHLGLASKAADEISREPVEPVSESKAALLHVVPSSVPATPVRDRTKTCPDIFSPVHGLVFPRLTPGIILSTPTRTPVSKGKRMRTPASGTSPSPSKRRRLDEDNKENTPVIASVMSRILNRTPVFSKPEKRAVPQDGDDDEPVHRVLKKSKSFPPSLPNDDEERSVASQLLPAARGKVFDQRRVMESVVPPPLSEVFSSRYATPSSKFAQRLSRSACKASQRNNLPEDDSDGTATPTISFITKLLGTPLPEMSLLNSDDSIMADDTETSSSSDVPSDDVLIGLVTPHRIISPTLRRSSFNDDPPSDDSNPGSSPTRHVAARMLSRQNSFQRTPIQPLRMLAREDL